MKFNQILKLLFISLILKSILWVFLVPLWHTPDEQAHFGHVAFIAEGGDLKRHGKYPDMTEEIYTSLEILGTKRDQKGNNKFTFHPEHRMPFSSNLNGPQEKEIKSLPIEARQNFVIKESAYYPHFFYQISSLTYKLVYQANLFIRVFAVRLSWVFSYWLMIWLTFKTAKLIFPKNNLMVLVITLLTGFHPMLQFVASGVTSDNLYNLLFTTIIYFCIKIITKVKPIDFILLSLTLGIGFITKQQFIISLAIVVPALIIAILKNPKKNLKFFLFLPLAGLIGYILAPARFGHLIKIISKGQLPYLSLNPDRLIKPNYSLFDHFKWTIIHTIREVLPWYWGVFNWLGVVLPRTVNRILIRLLGLAGLGLIIKFVKVVKKRQFNQQNLNLAFTAYSAFIYFIALMVWDWTFTRRNGFSFGIQGRYYFPVILTHMIMLAVGINSVFKLFNQKLASWSSKILSLWFILLNFVALHTVAKAYYHLSSFKTFIIQASQYKPWFAKGTYLVIILIAFILTQLILVFKLLKYDQKNS